jgi:hypothetical protein
MIQKIYLRARGIVAEPKKPTGERLRIPVQILEQSTLSERALREHREAVQM